MFLKGLMGKKGDWQECKEEKKEGSKNNQNTKYILMKVSNINNLDLNWILKSEELGTWKSLKMSNELKKKKPKKQKQGNFKYMAMFPIL